MLKFELFYDRYYVAVVLHLESNVPLLDYLIKLILPNVFCSTRGSTLILSECRLCTQI